MDLNATTISMLILSVLIVLFVIIYFTVKWYRKNKTKQIGKKGEKDVSKILRQIAKKNRWKVIDDLYLPLYDKTTQIDHLIIAPFGVLAVETKALNGEIYGGPNDQNWTQIIGEKKHRFYNPLLQNKAHIDCIRHILRKENVYKVEIESLVVFSSKHAELIIPSGMPVISLDLLKKYLKKSRFHQDNGINVETVYSTLLKHQVTDKNLLKNHNDNVKKMAANKH